MVTGRAQPQGAGRRPVEERIRGRIQGRGTRRGWGRNKRLGRCGGKVGRPGAPQARNERQRRQGRSGRTGCKEQTLFIRKWTLSVRKRTLSVRKRVLFFPYNTFHMYTSINNIVYFTTWYEFPASPVHGGHYYS